MGIPYIGIPYIGIPYTGIPYTGIPYIGIPYIGIPYTGIPYIGSGGLGPPKIAIFANKCEKIVFGATSRFRSEKAQNVLQKWKITDLGLKKPPRTLRL